ncbi:hypothetical protein [Leptospira noumeaensis]|uniref:hypothetical protein n=1 Tax=Leptospira noumeaensis TaxID=2484964 RepID=UPI001ABF08FC|nr:hypothetical protein [Leptospira noumeaensis]
MASLIIIELIFEIKRIRDENIETKQGTMPQSINSKFIFGFMSPKNFLKIESPYYELLVEKILNWCEMSWLP